MPKQLTLHPFQKLTYNDQLSHLTQIAAALQRHYPIVPSEPALLQFENNAVFQINPTGSDPLIIRIAMPWGRTAPEQLSEIQWLQSLRRETSLTIPNPLANNNGDFITTIGSHVCVILRRIEGEPPNPGLTIPTIERIGAFTAQLHRHSTQFTLPADFTRPRWDWQRLFGIHSVMHDPRLSAEQRLTLQNASLQIQTATSDPAVETGLIHADLHRDNILIRNSSVAAIDFDDCGFGYLLYDIASILESFNRRIFNNPAEVRAGKDALLCGYNEIRPLPPGSTDHLNLFMSLRATVTLDFILRSQNASTQEWGLPRIPELVQQITLHIPTKLNSP